MYCVGAEMPETLNQLSADAPLNGIVDSTELIMRSVILCDIPHLIPLQVRMLLWPAKFCSHYLQINDSKVLFKAQHSTWNKITR